MLTCFIRYQLDPFQREAFREYAEHWGSIIPRQRAQRQRFILREERTFCEVVEGTLGAAPESEA